MKAQRKGPVRREPDRAGRTLRRAAKEATSSLSDPSGDRIVLLRFPMEPEWQADDRLWFLLHPDRNHRLRRTYDGELEAEGVDPERDCPLDEWEVRWTLVRRLGPKMRRRCLIRAPSPNEAPEMLTLEHDEHKLRALADELLVERRNDRTLDFDRAMRRAAAYAASAKSA
jgi:hypothetical protein